MFEYHRPVSLKEACVLLRRFGGDALPLAGGTDLLVDIRRGAKRAGHLVSLADLDELRGVEVDGGELRIGALVTPAQLGDSELVRKSRPELLDAVAVFGTPQVRNRATVGGSLCTAASCGDLAPLMVALGARVEVAGPEGTRELTLEVFFQQHRRTALEAGEILVAVKLPVRSAQEGAAYRAFGLRADNFITVAGVAVWLNMEGGVCAGARIALGAVAPTPLRAPAAEARLVGTTLEKGVTREAARAAREAAVPISDLRGSEEHRRELVEALCERALAAAKERVG
ncbi:MAG: FAD binding domain-containing protein [Longimicrobiales bacterium]